MMCGWRILAFSVFGARPPLISGQSKNPVANYSVSVSFFATLNNSSERSEESEYVSIIVFCLRLQILHCVQNDRDIM